VIFLFLKNKEECVVYRALLARDKACLNADLLLLADLSAILSALFTIRTLKAALFSSLFRLFATICARWQLYHLNSVLQIFLKFYF